MPDTTGARRTRRVKTITEEEQEVSEKENQGLGMPWQEYLAGLSDADLSITTIYVYRKDPPTISGFLLRLGGGGEPAERIDEQWLQDRFGGGTFDLAIRSKDGKSHYERGLRIAGPPKLTAREQGVAPVPAPSSSADASNARIVELLEKTIDRLSTLQQTPVAAANPAIDSVVSIMSSAAQEAVKIAGAGRAGEGSDRMESNLDRAFKDAMIKKLLASNEGNSLDADLARLTKLRELIQPAEAGGPKSLVAQLKELGELRELMGWGGGGEGKKTILDLGAEIIQSAPAILEKWGEIADRRVAVAREDRVRTQVVADAYRRGGGRPSLPTSATPATGAGAPGTSSAFRMVPLGAEEALAAETDDAGAAAPGSGQPGGLDTESEAFVNWVKGRIVELVEAGQDGEAIVDFLDGVQQQKFIEMLGQFSAQQITDYLRRDPVLGRVTENPRWPEVLAQAQAYVRGVDAEPSARPPGKPRPN